jgi:hypothetical protein
MSHTLEQALEIAAQCWCDEQTSHIEMDTVLATAFAKRLLVLMQQRDDLTADAMRYRWLRETNNTRCEVDVDGVPRAGDIDMIMVWDGICSATALNGDDLDKAIDAAIAKVQEVQS